MSRELGEEIGEAFNNLEVTMAAAAKNFNEHTGLWPDGINFEYKRLPDGTLTLKRVAVAKVMR